MRPTQKDHVTNEEVKSCNNHKIQEIIMGNHAITSCTNAHATTSHTTLVVYMCPTDNILN